jgi:hypothetical protein
MEITRRDGDGALPGTPPGSKEAVGRRALRSGALRSRLAALLAGVLLAAGTGLAATTGPGPPKPPAAPATKAKGAGLYTSGGRVYARHGEAAARSKPAPSEAYQNWKALQQGGVKKPKPVSKPVPRSAKGRASGSRHVVPPR